MCEAGKHLIGGDEECRETTTRGWNVYGFMVYEQRMNYLLATLMYCLVYCRCKRGFEDGWVGME